MKTRNIVYLIIVVLTSAFTACTYEYDMPSDPHLTADYKAGELPYKIRQNVAIELEDLGWDGVRSTLHFTPNVYEYDKNGKLLYVGEPQAKPSQGTTKVELGFKAKGNDSYKEFVYGTLKFNKRYNLERMPGPVELNPGEDDDYSFDTRNGSKKFILQSDFNDVIARDLDALNFEDADCTYSVAEYNDNGVLTNKKEEYSLYGFTSLTKDSTKTLTVIVHVGARLKDVHTWAPHLLTYTFRGIELQPNITNKITLASNLAYIREGPDYGGMACKYVLRDSLKQVEKDMKDEGYTVHLSTRYKIAEKDKDGNVLKTYETTRLNSSYNYSEKDAVKIDVVLDTQVFSEKESTWISFYEYSFKDIPLDPTKETHITLNDDMPYTKTKL